MPENDQPMWPSSDEDRSSSGARKTTPMSLPDPPASPPEKSGVPKVTGSEAPKGSWFAPNVEPEPIPGLNAPAEEPPPSPSPAKQDLADRLGSREPKQKPAEAEEAPVAEATQFIEVKQPEKQPEKPEKPETPVAESTQYIEATPSEEKPDAQSTQQQAPWVPVERNVWPGEQQERHDEPPSGKPEAQPWREELQLWREEQQRREEQLKRAEPQRREEPPQQPWAQRLDVPDERRAALPPEPPRGVVPSASVGSLARPMRIEPDGQRFDAEATVGIERPTQFPGVFQQQPQPRTEPPAEPPPPPAAQPAAEEPPKKKRRKGNIIALVVVVLLVLAGGGIAAAMPKVSNRLGLPWAPNAPKGDSPDPVAATRELRGPDTSGQAPTADGVKSVLAGPAGNGALGQLNGSVVDPVTGTTLWDHSSATAVTPASTTKVLTTAAALLALDPDTRLSTKIVQGADPGTVILVGGGDVR